MPARKVKNDNKERELIEKIEKFEKGEDTAEQINIEEEQVESKRGK